MHLIRYYVKYMLNYSNIMSKKVDMHTALPLLTIKQSINAYKHLLKPDPGFGMDFFADDFEAKELVLLEDNEAGGQGIPLRFDYYALLLRLKGETKRTINQFDYVIKPQSLQLINPGSIFSFEDTSDVAKTYVLLFDKTFIEEENVSLGILGQLLDFHRKYQEDVLLDMTQFAEVVTLYEQLNRELRAKKSDYKIIVRLLITQLLYLLKRAKLSSEQKQDITRAQQISSEFLNLVEEHYWQQKSVKEYAKILGISPQHLSETIKSTLYHTALFYIHVRLIKEIQYLLCFSDMSIKQISHAINFETPSQLGRFFKRYEGMSPKAYRLKNR